MFTLNIGESLLIIILALNFEQISKLWKNLFYYMQMNEWLCSNSVFCSLHSVQILRVNTVIILVSLKQTYTH